LFPVVALSWSEAGRLPIPAFGIALSFDGSVALLEREFFAEIWKRGPAGWFVDGRRGTANGEQTFPRPGIALSRDGKIAALGDSGKLLIVGAPLDPSNAVGIDGDRNDDSAPERGAVWVY